MLLAYAPKSVSVFPGDASHRRHKARQAAIVPTTLLPASGSWPSRTLLTVDPCIGCLATSPQVNFTRATEEWTLPFDVYRILQISSVASKDSCARALDDLLRNPSPGFSHQAQYARAAILQRAADVLLDGASRRQYDQQLLLERPSLAVASSEVDGKGGFKKLYRSQARPAGSYLVTTLVPRVGVLMLLQESGEWQSVIEQGTAYLNHLPQGQQAQDVALATAQAHCDAAAVAVDEPGDAGGMQACSHMQAALRILQAHQSSPDLQRDIEAALGEMAPKVTLQQLSDPNRVQYRAQGLATLKQLVKHKAPGWKELFESCAPHLTTSEMIELSEADKATGLLSADDLQTALLVAGCLYRQPGLVQEAFRKMQDALPDGQGDMAVPCAVCCLLMGDSPAAEAILGFGPTPAGMHVDGAIQDFVKEHSIAEDDLLPGLCLLAEQWLLDVAFPRFSDSRGSTFSLGTWFEDPGVAAHLKGSPPGPSAHVAKAFHAARSGMVNATGRAASFLTGAAQGLLPSFSQSRPEPQPAAENLNTAPAKPSSQAAEPRRSDPAELQATAPRASADSSSAGPPDAHELHSRLDATEPESTPTAGSPTAVHDKKVPRVTASILVEPPGSHQEHAPRRRIRQRVSLGNETKTAPAMGGGVIDGIITFKEERDMWSGAPTQSPMRRLLRRMFGWTLIGGAAAVGLMAMGVRLPSTRSSLPAVPSQAALSPQLSEVQMDGEPLNQAKAQQLLEGWNQLKAQALGSQHDTECLPSLLDGNMLERWSKHVQDSAASNQYVTYDSMKLSVDSVKASAPECAKILATIQEEATLHSHGAADSITSTYSIEYDCAKRQGGWRIVDSSAVSPT